MRKILLLILTTVFAFSFSNAQTVLSPGDIAVLGIQADTPDDFQFVTFVDLEAGTQIHFTDCGVKADGTIRTGEGGNIFTADAAVSAGTIFGFISNAGLFTVDGDYTAGAVNLSTSGDQIIAYQGSLTTPTYLWAMQINSTLWQTECDNTNTSTLPTGLIDGVTAVAAGYGPGDGDEWDNAVYNMAVTSGTVSDLQAFIGNASFYIGLNTIDDYVEPKGTLTILADVADTDAPVWETGYPTVVASYTSVEITSQIDEVGKAYYMVVPSGSTAPSVAEIVAGVDYGDVTVTASGSFFSYNAETKTIAEGLEEGTDYDVYVVAADNEMTPNIQASAESFAVSTLLLPDILLNETFDTDLGTFTAVSVTGDVEGWYWEAYSGNGYMEMGDKGDEASVDWLISGAFNLDAATEEKISFKSANNFGDATTTLTVFLSDDFTGEYTPAGIASATWDDVTSEFTLSSGGSYNFFESGEKDISDGTGTGYIAFVYTYPGGGSSGMWEIDDVKVTGYTIQGSDATLSSLLVDDVAISDFDAATLTYTVELAAGVTTVPTVTYTTTDDNATAVLTDATVLTGDNAARTTTIEVTAQDNVTTVTYSILFNPVIEVATIADLRAATDLTRKYKITGDVTITHTDSYRNKKYIEDATGAVEIDDDPGVITTVYNVGDVISGVTGTLQDYFDYLQMHPTENPGASTKTNTVEPQLITISEFNSNFEAYEAEFIKIEGLTFADAGGTFGVGKNYVVSNGTDNTVVRTAFSAVSGTIPKMADVQGVALWHFSEAKIAPRNLNDLMVYSSDADLTDLTYNSTSVNSFSAATLSYNVQLAVGQTTIPTIGYTKSDADAQVAVDDVTDLFGTEVERTATITVTAVDGTEKVYEIIFTVDQTGIADHKLNFSIYPVPADNFIKVSGLKTGTKLEIINITGVQVKTIEVTDQIMDIEISNLNKGIYLLRSGNSTHRFVKK
jgi:Domain of unknown function (DUF5017)/Secretion system C-terminal sorting domain